MDADRSRTRARRGLRAVAPLAARLRRPLAPPGGRAHPCWSMTSEMSALSYAAQPPVLVVGDTPASIARGAAAVVASGLSVAARVALEDAEPRLDGGSLPVIVFVEIDGTLEGDGADRLDRLLVRLNREAEARRISTVVSTSVALIDAVAGRLVHPRAVQLAGATDEDRERALAAAMRLDDIGVREPAGSAGDSETARLRFLTDEVGRIAGALARLSRDALSRGDAGTSAIDLDTERADATELARIVKARRLRGRHFDPTLFADPAWDMLLDLMVARIAGKPVAVSSLCIAAAVPATTALRWIRMLTDAGLFVRHADPNDGRRVFIDLSEDAAAAMRAYLAALRSTSA